MLLLLAAAAAAAAAAPPPRILYAAPTRCNVPADALPAAVRLVVERLPPERAEAWLLCYDSPPRPAGSVGELGWRVGGVRVVARTLPTPQHYTAVPKMRLWKHLVKGSDVKGFDVLLLWDSDVAPTPSLNVTRLAAWAVDYGLAIAQPVLSGNVSRAESTGFRGVSACDYPPGDDAPPDVAVVAAVEQMAPVYLRSAWECVHASISTDRRYWPGWGLAHIHAACACELLGGLGRQYAVVSMHVEHRDTGTTHGAKQIGGARSEAGKRSEEYYRNVAGNRAYPCGGGLDPEQSEDDDAGGGGGGGGGYDGNGDGGGGGYGDSTAPRRRHTTWFDWRGPARGMVERVAGGEPPRGKSADETAAAPASSAGWSGLPVLPSSSELPPSSAAAGMSAALTAAWLLAFVLVGHGDWWLLVLLTLDSLLQYDVLRR